MIGEKMTLKDCSNKHFCIVLFLFLFFNSNAPAQHQEKKQTTPQDTVKVQIDTVIISKDDLPRAPVPKDSIANIAWRTPYKIEREQINNILYEDSRDLSYHLPGVFWLDPGNAGQLLKFTRHGANSKQTALFLDNRRFYNPIYGDADVTFLPIGFIHQISVHHSLSSIEHTQHAEILSYETETYNDNIPYSQIYHHKASGYSDVDFVFGQPVSGKTEILVGGALRSYGGDDGVYKYDHQNLRAKIQYHHSANWRVNYSILHNNIRRLTPGQKNQNDEYLTPQAVRKDLRQDHTLNIHGSVLNSANENVLINLYYSTLFFQHKDSENNLKLKNNCYYTGFNTEFQHQIWGQNFYLGTTFEHDWISTDIVGIRKNSFGSVRLGNEWNWEKKVGFRILSSINIRESQSPTFSGGISGYFYLFKNSKLTAAMRQNNRFPTYFELYSRTNQLGNQELITETHKKLIIGLENQLLERLNIGGYFYQKNIDNIIRFHQVDSTTYSFQNADGLQFYGFDLRLNMKISSHLLYSSSVIYLDNQSLFDQPDFQFNGFFRYKNSYFQDGLKTEFRLDWSYIGERTNIVEKAYQYSSDYKTLPSAFVLTAQAKLNFGNLSIFLMLENIFDNDYEIIYGYPMNGRTFHYGLRWEFWN